MLDEKHGLIRNTALNAIAQLSAMAVGFVLMPWLLRAFGAVQYGLYVLVSAIAAYAALADLGIGTAVVRAVAEWHADGDKDALDEALGTALTFYAIVGSTVAIAMVVVGRFSGSLFRVGPMEADILRWMLWITAGVQLFQWPASLARHVLIGMTRYDLLARISLGSTVLFACVASLVVVFGKGPVALTAANALVLLLGSAATAYAARRVSGITHVAASLRSGQRFKSMVVFGWAVFVIELADVLFYQQTDRLILGIVLGAVAVSLYEASGKVNGLITYLSGLAVSAVMPIASRLDAAGRHETLRALFVRGTRYTACFIAPIAMVVAVLSRPLLRAWLGPLYADQAALMRVLVLPHVLLPLGLMGDMILIGRGRMGKRVPYILGQALINVVLSVALVQPKFGIGILGVGIGTAAAHLVDFPIHMRFLLREMGVSASEWLREIVVPVYRALLVPGVIAGAAYFTPLPGSLLGLAAVAVAALAVYWVLFYRFSLSSQEQSEVRNIIKMLRHQGA